MKPMMKTAFTILKQVLCVCAVGAAFAFFRYTAWTDVIWLTVLTFGYVLVLLGISAIIQRQFGLSKATMIGLNIGMFYGVSLAIVWISEQWLEKRGLLYHADYSFETHQQQTLLKMAYFSTAWVVGYLLSEWLCRKKDIPPAGE